MILRDTGSTFTPCPAGTYPARCIQLIDLGTQASEWQGQVKRQRKLVIVWEILDPETRKDDGSPFLLNKSYNAILMTMASLRKDLASWRGRDFTPEELKGFRSENVLNQPCLLSVIHDTKPDGRVFANISGIMKAPRGMAVPPATGPLLSWSMDNPDWPVFAQLSSRLADKIAASPEYKLLDVPKTIAVPATPMAVPARQAAPARPPAPPAAKYEPPATDTGSGFDDLDDDIPF